MIDKDAVDYLFGLFGESHIRFGDQRVPEEDPTITEMTTKAIEVLTSTVSLSNNLHSILYLLLSYSTQDKELKLVFFCRFVRLILITKQYSPPTRFFL